MSLKKIQIGPPQSVLVSKSYRPYQNKFSVLFWWTERGIIDHSHFYETLSILQDTTVVCRSRIKPLKNQRNWIKTRNFAFFGYNIVSTPFASSQGTSQIHHQPLPNVTFTHAPTAGLFWGIPSYLSNTPLTEVKFIQFYKNFGAYGRLFFHRFSLNSR